MVYTELLEYIKSVRAQGFPDDVIRNHLITNGYKPQMIDDAFKELIQPTPLVQQNVRPTSRKISLLPFIIVGLVLVLGIFAYLFLHHDEPTECGDYSVEIYIFRDEPYLCINAEKTELQFIVRMEGDPDFLGVEVKGSSNKKLRYNKLGLSDINLMYADRFPFDKPIDRIDKVIFTPGIRNVECKSKSIEVSQVRDC